MQVETYWIYQPTGLNLPRWLHFFVYRPEHCYLYRNRHQRCSLSKCVLRNLVKFTKKYLCKSLFFNKVAGLRPATLLKKRLWHRCFLVNFEKFLRISLLQNTSGKLLLKRAVLQRTLWNWLFLEECYLIMWTFSVVKTFIILFIYSLVTSEEKTVWKFSSETRCFSLTRRTMQRWYSQYYLYPFLSRFEYPRVLGGVLQV